MHSGSLLVMGTVAFDTVATVDRLPRVDDATRVTERVELAGGAAGNVAMALARLGGAPRLVTSVGPDFQGSAYEAALREAGVSLAGVWRSGRPTAHAWMMSDPDGRQQIYYHDGASLDMAECAVTEAAWGHFAAGEIKAYPRFMAACDVVSFDPGQEVLHRPLADVAACLPLAHHLFVNRHERKRLEDGLDLELTDFFSDKLEAIVETRGAAGALITTPEGVARVPAASAQSVDPTGAGDAHRAGYIWGVRQGLGLPEAAKVGAVAAAFAVEVLGSQPNLPTLEALRKRYEAAFGAWPL